MRFIKVYDNALSKEYCQKVIQAFDLSNEMKITTKRNDDTRIDSQKEFSTPFLTGETRLDSIDFNMESICQEFFSTVVEKTQEYLEDIHIQEDIPGWYMRNMVVQKNDHTDCGGYHRFHCENLAPGMENRFLVYMLYLNDVPEGEGETEFLHQGLRIQPKAGSLLIWPAGFTHLHRGNPVNTTTKYIATGWVFLNPSSV
jgi:hypothetical protein